jgi:uncharacterized repeat protein (TIGR01451 family)
MGTKTNSRRRHRASRRGLASFVSFLLLFAFALGQSGSLIALADDAGTAPAATEDAGSDGVSRVDTLPTEEAPTDEAPAEEAPAAVEGPGDSGASSGNGAASVSGPTSGTRTLTGGRADKLAAASARPEAAPVAGLEGGDVSLDFVAAGPFTYNHATGLGTPPQFGYDTRTISKTNGVVESLEGGDFECGDLVTFFVQVQVAGDAAGSGAVELDMSFGNETTGQPGIGFDNIVSVAINTPDGGNVGLDGTETATLSNEHLDTAGYDEVKGTVTVSGLDAGETAIVRIIVHLACEIGSPTGNILNAIDAARVVGGGTVNVGQETVPMKQVGDVAQPGMNVDKTCPAFALVGDTISYSISIENTGNESLNITSVVDTVNGHAGVNITASFPASVAAGTTVTRTYAYTVLAGDPSPLTNSVAVVANGAISHATINGSASCENPILHPEITITKSCPQTALAGDDISYQITIENTGDEMLDTIVVTDTVNGNSPVDISNLFVDALAPGASDTQEYVYGADGTEPDPLPNSATVTANGATSDEAVTDTDSCSTDITHAPAIDVTKSCPETVAFGEDITYTITVTNTGNEALEGVVVNDTLLGDITGEFDFDFSGSFGVGEVATATVTYSPGADEDPVDNTVTATGNGADSGAEASDEASCRTDVTHAPAIDVTKSCPETVAFGEDITYTITVTNTGNEALENLLVSDALLGGDITAAFNFTDPLPVGGVASADFTYTPGADEDPVANSVTASGDGVDSGVQATDTAVCTSDVSNPGISILKTVDQEVAPIGTTVTFTYVITNTGDVTLYNISVDDDILGHIGDIAQLEPGHSATLTKDSEVTAEIVTNIGTAVGHDILGREVSASDDATVAPISGENPPPNNPPTPFTGSDAGRLGLITMVLFGIGVTVVASTRRRRPKGEAA